MRVGRSAAARGLVLLIVLAGVAAAAPWIAPQPADRQDLGHRLEGPDSRHPLGRDELGRDLLARVVWGARISLVTGVAVVLISGGVGVALGTAAGYAGGTLDLMVGALIDLLLGFPGVLLAIALVAVLGPRLSHVVVALCLIGWVGYARLARGSVLSLRERPFFDAARSLGAGPPRLLLRHLLPNLLGPIVVQASLGLGGVILSEAGLSFLGLGVPPPAPSWGSMLRDGSQLLLDAPRLTLVPGAAIFLAVLGANLVGEGLRERLDPGRAADPRDPGPRVL